MRTGTTGNLMETPICDFVRGYAQSGVSRLHMPGHKGRPVLGCEPLDITEVAGADELYAPTGIIAQSEANAAALFGAAATFYSTEGSSQCIRAMLALAVQGLERPVVLAARNAHKAFLYAAALLDFDVAWLWPEERQTLCACPVSPALLERALSQMEPLPCAVYVTSPDYLGGMLDLSGLAAVCSAHGIPLLVDNAHGAYLHFLSCPVHPLDLGAAACCDSAHKTLPVLTGGAYLHIGKTAPAHYTRGARRALELFGSTSPSYLTLQSLDRANAYLTDQYGEMLALCAERVELLRTRLRGRGWAVLDTEPLKLTLDAAASGHTGKALADRLRRGGVECEYADPDFTVLMFTPENGEADFDRIAGALGRNEASVRELHRADCFTRPGRAMPIRQAMFAPHERIPVKQAVGRVCGAPVVSCPPAVPVICSGEIFDEDTVRLCRRYGLETAEVVREQPGTGF